MYHRFTHKKRYRRKHKTDYHVFMRRLLRLKPDRSLVVAVVAMVCRINVNTKLVMEQTGQPNKTGTIKIKFINITNNMKEVLIELM